MFRFTEVSKNKKTGPIPTTMTAKKSCPPTCPFLENGCYAASGPTNLWWNKCDMDLVTFLGKVKRIPRRQLWRHDVAGDLVHKGGLIDRDFLRSLVAANGSSHGFTYTHHDPYKGSNLDLIREANDNGFTVNLSANSEAEALEFKAFGLPVCVVVSSDTTKNFKIEGEQVIICPAAKKGSDMTCARCKLCQKRDRNCIVGFPAHGNGKKKVDNIVA